jgi:hypothetical protein
MHALLGHIAAGWGHVHLAERRAGHYVNPLRAGALTPFHDFGAPVIDRIVAEAAGKRLDPRALTGVVNLLAVAHDNPPFSAPPPWHGLPVTPRSYAGGSSATHMRSSPGESPPTSAADSSQNALQRDLRIRNTPKSPQRARPLPLLARP